MPIAADVAACDGGSKVGVQVFVSMKHFAWVPNVSWKLTPRYIGLVTIAEVIGPKHLAYRVELHPPLHQKHNVFHISSLKRYHTGKQSGPLMLPPLLDNEVGWKVDFMSETKVQDRVACISCTM